LFIFILLISIFINLTTNSWFIIWVSLEINLLFIIPLINNKYKSIESSIKYFLIQRISSTIIFFRIIYLNEFYISIFINTAIFIKIGIAPFHFWYPEVMEGLNYYNCLLIITIQKIPLINILNLNFNLYYLNFIVIIRIYISSIHSLNQTSLRKLIAFSSINHISWILINLILSLSNLILYFLIYFWINFIILINFIFLNIFYIKNIQLQNIFIKLIFLIEFLSIGGIPPFLGFYPKWITIQLLLIYQNYFLAFFMIIFTLIILYIYTRIFFSSLILKLNSKKIEINLIFYLNSLNIVLIFRLIFCFLILNFN